MQSTKFLSEFEVHIDYLNHFALQLTKDKNQAKDLFQETALRAFHYQNKYSPDTNLKAWLGTIMKNSFINFYRKKKRRREVQDNTEEHYFLSTPKNSIGNEGETSVNMKELLKIVDTLSDDYRIPFLMVYQGYSYEEIQEAMNLPLGTVKSRIFHARKMLRNKIPSVFNPVAA